MTPDNITGGGDLKAQSLFENIETLLKKKNYKEALEIIETNKTYLQTHSDMKYQVLLNKYNADALYHVTLYAYEKDSDEMLFEKLFTEHRSYLEVHLDKQSYAKLLKIEGFIKNRRRAKRTRVLLPVLIVAILVGSFGIYRALNNDEPPAVTQNGDGPENPDQGEDISPSDNPDAATDAPELPDGSIVDAEDDMSELPADPDDPADTDDIAGDYILPSDTKELTRADIEDMSAEDIRLAINEMYARKGYDFGAGSVQRYFEEQSWYEKDEDLATAADAAARFTDLENRNLSFLAGEERRLKNN